MKRTASEERGSEIRGRGGKTAWGLTAEALRAPRKNGGEGKTAFGGWACRGGGVGEALGCGSGVGR